MFEKHLPELNHFTIHNYMNSGRCWGVFEIFPFKRRRGKRRGGDGLLIMFDSILPAFDSILPAFDSISPAFDSEPTEFNATNVVLAFSPVGVFGYVVVDEVEDFVAV